MAGNTVQRWIRMADFWETFSWQVIFTLRVFPRNLLRGNRERNIYFFHISFWCLIWDTSPGFMSNKSIHYLLDYGDFGSISIVCENYWNISRYSCISGPLSLQWNFVTNEPKRFWYMYICKWLLSLQNSILLFLVRPASIWTKLKIYCSLWCYWYMNDSNYIYDMYYKIDNATFLHF